VKIIKGKGKAALPTGICLQACGKEYAKGSPSMSLATKHLSFEKEEHQGGSCSV